jgi:hypothetical protein
MQQLQAKLSRVVRQARRSDELHRSISKTNKQQLQGTSLLELHGLRTYFHLSFDSNPQALVLSTDLPLCQSLPAFQQKQLTELPRILHLQRPAGHNNWRWVPVDLPAVEVGSQELS